MLHRCIEGERVGVDGSKIVDVDRRHDPCPGGVPAPPGERGSVATRPQMVKSLCLSVIPGSVMLTHTVLEDL